MNFEKVIQAMNECDDAIVNGVPGTRPVKFGIDSVPLFEQQMAHCRYMIAEVRTWGPERVEKAFRWLGFIQGVLWSHAVSSLSSLKKMNMPSEGDPR